MSFQKNRSLKVSERVFDLVSDMIDDYNEDFHKLSGYLQTFYNCREQGFCLSICDEDFDYENGVKDTLYVWVCESRNSDNIVVMWQTEYPEDNNNMFSEYTYRNRRKYFKYNEIYEAAQFIVEIILEIFIGK